MQEISKKYSEVLKISQKNIAMICKMKIDFKIRILRINVKIG